MKLIIPTTSLLFTLHLATASFTEMESKFTQIMKNFTVTDRAFAPNDFSVSLSLFTSYGCWCHSLETHTGKGKSKPLDALDTLCKRLSEGYDCASIDAEDEGESCQAWEENYSDASGNAKDCASLRTAEEVAHLDQATLDLLGIEIVTKCKRQACLIENDFIDGIAELVRNEPNAVNGDYKHDNNGFDIEASCVAESCEGEHCDGERKCCGDVPGRRSFKSISKNGVDRVCCGGVVFLDSGIMQCCDNADVSQVVAGVGQCP